MEHRYAYEPWRWFWEGPRVLLAVLSGTPANEVYPPRLPNEPTPSDRQLFVGAGAAAKLFYVAALVLPLLILGPAALALLRSQQVFGYLLAAVVAYITLSSAYRIFVARPKH